VTATKHKRKPKAGAMKKPPPRWRRYLVQAELELPPPAAGASPRRHADDTTYDDDGEFVIAPLQWWQSRAVIAGLAALCLVALAMTGFALHRAALDRTVAADAQAHARMLTLRASSSERDVRITPNPRSWSAAPDLVLHWPEPPQMLDIYLPVGYAQYSSFAVTIDKVDHGRVMVAERMSADSNRDLRLSLNSSAFGPGEYRMRLQGYTWRGLREDAGWVRLVIR
jgi:hypothetical protein